MPPRRPPVSTGALSHSSHVVRILQRMPRRMYRLHPEIIPDLVAWLTVIREPFAKIASQGCRGADAHERLRRKGERQYGRNMCRAIDALMVSLMETRDADAVDAARALWDDAIRGQQEG